VEIDDVVGMENLESIVTVPELDGVMLNPQVLASSMGLGMGSSHPAVREAEQRLLDATQKAGIIAGVLIAQPSPQEFTRLLKDGFLLVAYGMDVWFLVRTCAETIQHLRHIMDTARAK
jgi:2-keto-3-deoxy-L-rhamnonate aldolase RhmA